MFAKPKFRRPTAREFRLLALLVIVMGIAVWKFTPRPWKPTITMETQHYSIASTSSRAQVEKIAQVVEILYASYSNQFSTLPTFQHDHAKLKLRLYKDRDECREVNPGMGWAEAFYKNPYCHAYYSAREVNPYHWMLHEAVHQLNNEVAHLHLEKWLEEGTADYFGSSRITKQTLHLDQVDWDTYPVWHMDMIATNANLSMNLDNGSVIPLRSIITGQGGPWMSSHVNLYYLHWWTLTHFIFENPAYQGIGIKLMQEGVHLPAVEQLIGPTDKLQREWHQHIRQLKTKAGSDL